jgi:hypothetical protein
MLSWSLSYKIIRNWEVLVIWDCVKFSRKKYDNMLSDNSMYRLKGQSHEKVCEIMIWDVLWKSLEYIL